MPKPAQKRPAATRRGRHDLAALRGSIPPLITPFSNGAVDYDKYAELVSFQIEQGSHGILVNGTTAEPSTLTIEERNRLVTVAVVTAAGRVPVVAATGSQSLAESRALTEHAVAAGADALLIVTPYYIRPPQRGLVAVLPRARVGPRRAVDDLSHPGPHRGQRHARHAEGVQGQVADTSSA